jgi:hypothetical protein
MLSNLFHGHVCLMFILRSTSNHIPLKFRCIIYCYVELGTSTLRFMGSHFSMLILFLSPTSNLDLILVSMFITYYICYYSCVEFDAGQSCKKKTVLYNGEIMGMARGVPLSTLPFCSQGSSREQQRGCPMEQSLLHPPLCKFGDYC